MEDDHQQAIVEIQREHQFAINYRDNRIQTIQYENVDLQGDIRNARQTITDMIENRYAPNW